MAHMLAWHESLTSKLCLMGFRNQCAGHPVTRCMITSILAATLQLGQGVQSLPAVPEYLPDESIRLQGDRRTKREHDEIYARNEFPYIVRQGTLLFVGAQHSYTLDHPQLDKIRSLWNEFKPDVALIEGRITGYQGDLEKAALRGEPYFVYALATKAGVPTYTLEPPAKVEGAALAKAEGAEKALFYITLRGYLSRKRTQSNIPDSVVQLMLTRRAMDYGLVCDLKTVEQMDARWKQYNLAIGDWRQIEERETWPGEEKTFLNRLANLANLARDDHWAKTMVDLVRKGKRVFAVGGASHAIHLEPVLKASLKSEVDTPRAP